MKTLLTVCALVALVYGQAAEENAVEESNDGFLVPPPGTARFGTSGRIGNKTYYIGTSQLNFWRALEHCRIKGMQLASVADEEEHNFLTSYARRMRVDHMHLWTSGMNYGDQFRYVWLADGSPMNYNGWFGECPRCMSRPDQCVMLTKLFDPITYQLRRFYRQDCNETDEMYFVCQKIDNQC